MTVEALPQGIVAGDDCVKKSQSDLEFGTVYHATRSNLNLKVAELEGAAFEVAKTQAGLGFASPRVGCLILTQTLLGGAGLLGVARGFGAAGFVVGVVMLLICSLLSAFGAHLLSCVARTLAIAPGSFSTSAQALMPQWTWILDLLLMFKGFGISIIYMTLVGDLVPEAGILLGITVQRWQAIVVGASVALPLAVVRNLSTLRYAAFYAMFVVTWTTVVIILFCMRVGNMFQPCDADEFLPCHGSEFVPVGTDLRAMVKAFPIFIFAFTCHENVFTICNELKNASAARINTVIGVAYPLSAVVMSIVGVVGYATFGDKVHADILKSLPRNVVSEMTCLLYSAVAVCAFPLVTHPSRTAALALMRRVFPEATSAGLEDQELAIRVEKRRFYLYTFGYTVMSAVLAIFVELDLVIGLCGATGSTAVGYILPGLWYARAHPVMHVKRVIALAFAGLGLVLMPICLVAVFAL